MRMSRIHSWNLPLFLQSGAVRHFGLSSSGPDHDVPKSSVVHGGVCNVMNRCLTYPASSPTRGVSGTAMSP
jgi:hypothetical protein